MDIQQYISSGIIETYVMGLCSPAEESELEQLRQNYPELDKAIIAYEDELEKIIRLLEESNGFLPFHDKSDPKDIYAYFSMSKKSFKQVIGSLYKQRIITLEKDGIRLV